MGAEVWEHGGRGVLDKARGTARHVPRNTRCRHQPPPLPLTHTPSPAHTPTTQQHMALHPHHHSAPSCGPAQRYTPLSRLEWNRKTDGSKKRPKVQKHGAAVSGQAHVRTGGGGRAGGGGAHAFCGPRDVVGGRVGGWAWGGGQLPQHRRPNLLQFCGVHGREARFVGRAVALVGPIDGPVEGLMPPNIHNFAWAWAHGASIGGTHAPYLLRPCDGGRPPGALWGGGTSKGWVGGGWGRQRMK